MRVRVKGTLFCYLCRILAEHPVRDPDEPAPAYLTEPSADRSIPWRLKPRKCGGCGHVFWPLRKGHYACYWCQDRRAGHRDTSCSRCHQNNMIAPGLETTCVGCVTESAKNRDSYIDKVRRERSERLRGERP